MFWEEEIYHRYWEKKPHADTWWIAAQRPVGGIHHQMISGRRKHVSWERNTSGAEARVTGHCMNVQTDHLVISTHSVVRTCHTTKLNVWELSFAGKTFSITWKRGAYINRYAIYVFLPIANLYKPTDFYQIFFFQSKVILSRFLQPAITWRSRKLWSWSEISDI
jgi:hypothetical protein